MKKQYKNRNESRILVKSQFDKGIKSPSLISKETGVPLRTVKRYLSSLISFGKILNAKPTGRPRKNTSHLRRQLAQIKRQQPRAAAHVYAEELGRRNKDKVSTRTVQNALHQLGYHWRLPGRKKLTGAQKSARVSFAQAHADDDWGDTWSYDEAYFNLYRNSNRCWISTSTEESVQQPKLRSSQEKISVGICFAFCSHQKSALYFLPKNWSGPDLVKVFDESLLPSIYTPKRPSQKPRFIIDNDGRHHMTVWKNYISGSGIRYLSPWPSNSPDLNPIENLFAWMKKFVENKLPTSEITLLQTITESFNNIPQDHLKRLMDSMQFRMKDVINNNGNRINY